MPSAPISELHAFITVARQCSFRKASVVLGVSPSAVSHALRGLEERLGVRLLHRTTRSVAPTEAGHQLLQRLGPAFEEIEGALEEVNAFRATPAGTLRLNVPRAAAELILAPLLAPYLAANPGMCVEIAIDDALVDIVKEGFDAGVRFGESIQQDMVAIPLGPRQRFVVVGSPSYLERCGTPQTPDDLRQHACICKRFPDGSVYRRWEFARAEDKTIVDVHGPLVLSDTTLALRAAEDGIGLAYIYVQYAHNALDTGRVVTVLDDWLPTLPGFFLYYPGRKRLPAGLRAFISLVRQMTAQNFSYQEVS